MGQRRSVDVAAEWRESRLARLAVRQTGVPLGGTVAAWREEGAEAWRAEGLASAAVPACGGERSAAGEGSAAVKAWSLAGWADGAVACEAAVLEGEAAGEEGAGAAPKREEGRKEARESKKETLPWRAWSRAAISRLGRNGGRSGRDGGGGAEGAVRKAGATGRRWAVARAEKKTEGR